MEHFTQDLLHPSRNIIFRGCHSSPGPRDAVNDTAKLCRSAVSLQGGRGGGARVWYGGRRGFNLVTLVTPGRPPGAAPSQRSTHFGPILHSPRPLPHIEFEYKKTHRQSQTWQVLQVLTQCGEWGKAGRVIDKDVVAESHRCI